MKVFQLFEKTIKSQDPEQIKRQFINLAATHIYTKNRYETQVLANTALSDLQIFEFRTYSSWKDYCIRNDFDFQIDYGEVPRISINRNGIIALGKILNKITVLDKKEQNSQLEIWLNSLLRSAGWFVFRILKNAIILDPISQYPIEVPDKIYHISKSINTNSILKRGLIPKRGNYGDDFKYPPRVHVYLVKDFIEIKELALRIFNYNNIDSTQEYYPVSIFEIDTSKLNKGTRFYSDVSVDNGAWTYTHIPPAAISLIYED